MVLFLLAVVAGCKSKKPSLAGDEPIEIGDFIDFFPDAKLPFHIADSTLLRKEKDSLLISYKIFTQFVPDSILAEAFGNKARPKLYPLGKVKGNDDTYLFVKALSGNKRVAMVLGFDKKQVFLAAMPLLRLDQDPATQQAGIMDRGYSITKSVLRKNKNGSISEGKDVYVLNNDARNYTLIMTDALDDKVEDMVNPIDTFSRKQKFTADYSIGKLSFVSFRDGRKNDRLNFFIHFVKNNGDCSGELRGEAIMRSATMAEYRQAGDPCSVQFQFSPAAVIVKEIEGCGSRRGLRCSFNGRYLRKKEVKPKAAKLKTAPRK